MNPAELWQEYRAPLIALAAAVIAALSSVVVVPETEQAVVVRFGEPVRVINRFRPNTDFGQTGAGLSFRIPFAEALTRIDKRLLTVDMEQQQVLSTDQLRLNVDAYARFRIIDPVKMVRTAGTTERVVEQLNPILTSVLRQELGKRTFQSLQTADRGKAMEQIRAGLDREAREYGAQVIDVRIKRADLPDGALQPGYTGIRPKISAKGEPPADFRIDGPKDHGVAGLVNLYGIESPGLTSSLAIAGYVGDLLAQG